MRDCETKRSKKAQNKQPRNISHRSSNPFSAVEVKQTDVIAIQPPTRSTKVSSITRGGSNPHKLSDLRTIDRPQVAPTPLMTVVKITSPIRGPLINGESLLILSEQLLVDGRKEPL